MLGRSWCVGPQCSRGHDAGARVYTHGGYIHGTAIRVRVRVRVRVRFRVKVRVRVRVRVRFRVTLTQAWRTSA